jgi:hypothetical protein
VQDGLLNTSHRSNSSTVALSAAEIVYARSTRQIVIFMTFVGAHCYCNFTSVCPEIHSHYLPWKIHSRYIQPLLGILGCPKRVLSHWWIPTWILRAITVMTSCVLNTILILVFLLVLLWRVFFCFARAVNERKGHQRLLPVFLKFLFNTIPRSKMTCASWPTTLLSQIPYKEQ